MAEEQIEIRGVDELKANIIKALQIGPDKMNKAMRKAVRGWQEDVNSKFPRPDYGGDSRWRHAFAKSWKQEISLSLWGYPDRAEVTNSHRLFHLVENGHRMVLNGKETGSFVPGKHFKDSVNKKYEVVYPELLAQAAEEVLRNAGLL